jgi:hypothetical protein
MDITSEITRPRWRRSKNVKLVKRSRIFLLRYTVVGWNPAQWRGELEKYKLVAGLGVHPQNIFVFLGTRGLEFLHF